uniref:Conopeptide n=1 Tax=Conus lenavati TaxID=1519839 RepID=A0A0K8TU68_CONLV
MMSKMGAMFVLLLLFTLASSQQEGDVQARKTRLKSDFYRTLAMSNRGCTFLCGKECNNSCECEGNHEYCYCTNAVSPGASGCACKCRGKG